MRDWPASPDSSIFAPGVPDLVVEALSESTRKRDETLKRTVKIYRRKGNGPAQALLDHKTAQGHVEVRENELVLGRRRWRHDVVSVDELVAPVVLREEEVILVGQLQGWSASVHGGSQYTLTLPLWRSSI